MKISSLGIPAIMLGLTVAPAMADTLTVGTGNGNNVAPFGGEFNSNVSATYQQVYAATDFASNPISITGLTFFQSPSVGTGLETGVFTLSLSTTSKAVNGLDTTNFASNVGSNNTQVYSGLLAPKYNGSALSFLFAPFTYNPSLGNLLLDISATGLTPQATFSAFLANNGDANGVYSRATDFTIAGFNNYGLQTQFTFSAAGVAAAMPEASTWAMMILGVGAVGVSLRRRSKVITRVAFV